MNAVKIVLTCPRCGDSNWVARGEDFECCACGEICATEEMCSSVIEKQPSDEHTKNKTMSDCDGNCFSCERSCEDRKGTYCGG